MNITTTQRHALETKIKAVANAAGEATQTVSQLEFAMYEIEPR